MDARQRAGVAAVSGVIVTMLVTSGVSAQVPGLSMPPSGDNQHAIVTQYIGPVAVTIDYRSPNVTDPGGVDRTGTVWGGLVPYGMTRLGFGTCGDQCPWRGGANENTVFSVSHDVEIDGERLPAGRYGLHFIPGPTEWTVIFSKNATSWGSFFYDAREDALRVTVTPTASPHAEWLTYEFVEREPDRATVALRWERLQVPIAIRVADVTGLWVEAIRRDMRAAPGFSWVHQQAAAQFCLQHDVNLEEALGWARQAANPQVGGQDHFLTLSTLSQLLHATGHADEGATVLARAINHPTADTFGLHQFGRTLLARKRLTEAMTVFQANATRFDGAWPTHVGLMRGHAALGNTQQALEHARKALEQAPDDLNRTNLRSIIANLEAGRPIG